jgi:Family of unknown function (DUF6157)
MKSHTTNYFNTLILPSEDCPEATGVMPPVKADKPTVANYQFDLISQNPYKYNSDEVFFEVLALRQDLSPAERPAAREQFFSKGQPCMRCSPLTKRYGWALHSDAEGKVALIEIDSAEYKRLVAAEGIKKVKAMRG